MGFAVLGVAWTAWYLWHLAVGIIVGTGAGALLSAWWLTAQEDATKQAPEWGTFVSTLALSVATVLLWRATRALSRSTNVQRTTEGPFLRVGLHPDGGLPALQPSRDSFRNLDYGAYDPSFEQEDAADADLSPLLTGQPPHYINIVLTNQSTVPIGVAVEVSVTASLRFGGTGGVGSRHPFLIERTVEAPVLDPGASEAGRLFNVGNLPAYCATIDEVHYKDIMGRDRQAACGLGTLERRGLDRFVASPRSYKPRKGEYTDGVP